LSEDVSKTLVTYQDLPGAAAPVPEDPPNMLNIHACMHSERTSSGVRLLSPRLPQLCSSVCISEGLVNRLQSVQNAAARLFTGTRRSYTPVLRQLHWLPVRQSVDFKVTTLVHQSLSGISPSYLANDRRIFADVHERRLCIRSTAC